MANQVLGLGGAANDGTGDTLRAASDKINDNFLEIYTLIGDTSSLSTGISATASVVTLTAPTLTGVVGGTQTSATITTLATTTVNGTTLNGGTLALAAGSITDSSGAISFGNENLTTTGTITGALATAAQTAITSVGTLTALQVDNININGNAITSTAGTDLTITPVSGQQIVLDGTIIIDAGVVTGATSITSTAFVGDITGNVTGNATGTAATVTGAAQTNITSLGTLTTLTVDSIIINGTTIGHTSSTSAMTISSAGIVTFVDDILLKDACTIGTATTAGAIAIAADGTVDLATAGATVNSAVVKTAGLQTMYVPAAGMYPTTSNGCAALVQVEGTAGRPELKCLDFDASSDENAQFTAAFPKSWNAGVITFRVFFTVSGTNTGTVSWSLSAGSTADNGVIDTAFGTAVATTAKAHSGTNNDINVTAVSGNVTIANAADDTMTFFNVERDVSADNQSGDARLLGIQIFYTTSAATDS